MEMTQKVVTNDCGFEVSDSILKTSILYSSLSIGIASIVTEL